MESLAAKVEKLEGEFEEDLFSQIKNMASQESMNVKDTVLRMVDNERDENPQPRAKARDLKYTWRIWAFKFSFYWDRRLLGGHIKT